MRRFKRRGNKWARFDLNPKHHEITPAPLSTRPTPPPTPTPLDHSRGTLSLTRNVSTSMTRTCASGGFSMAIASSRRHRSFFSMYGNPRSAPNWSHSLSPRDVGPSNATSFSVFTFKRHVHRRKRGYKPGCALPVPARARFADPCKFFERLGSRTFVNTA